MNPHPLGILARTTDVSTLRAAAGEFLGRFVPDLYERYEEERIVPGSDRNDLRHTLTELQEAQKIAFEDCLSRVDFLSFLKLLLRHEEILDGKVFVRHGYEMRTALCLLDGTVCAETCLYSLEDFTSGVDIDAVLEEPEKWTLLLYSVKI